MALIFEIYLELNVVYLWYYVGFVAFSLDEVVPEEQRQ